MNYETGPQRLSVVDRMRTMWRREIPRVSDEPIVLSPAVKYHKDYFHGRRRMIRHLSDGTQLKDGAIFGKIDIAPQEPIKPDERFFDYMRDLKRDVKLGLEQLAERCKNNDPAFAGISAFGGYSRLGSIAERYGFEVRDIDPYDEVFKSQLEESAKDIPAQALGDNRVWRAIQGRPIPVQEILISRNMLIERYAPDKDIQQSA